MKILVCVKSRKSGKTKQKKANVINLYKKHGILFATHKDVDLNYLYHATDLNTGTSLANDFSEEAAALKAIEIINKHHLEFDIAAKVHFKKALDIEVKEL